MGLNRSGSIVFALFLMTSVVSGQDSLSAQLRISILTCAPGAELYSLYGHNAIRVEDRQTGSDVVFNYGTFDFNTPHFAIKFMRGRLPYLLSASTYADFLREYEYFERPVVEQELDLTADEKKRVVDYLGQNMLPENREYKYDFFHDNCATRLRDIINTAVPGLTWPETVSVPKTYRQLIKEYQQGWPWTDIGIDLIIGASADRVADVQAQAFIPDYLEKALRVAHRSDTPHLRLQYNQRQVLSFASVSERSPWIVGPFLLFLLLLGVEAYLFVLSREKADTRMVIWYDRIWLGIVWLACALMCIMWFGTDHSATKDNWNILWASPLWFAWPWRQRFGQVAKQILAVLLGVSCGVSLVNALPGCQFLPQFFNAVVSLLCAILLAKLWRQYRN